MPIVLAIAQTGQCLNSRTRSLKIDTGWFMRWNTRVFMVGDIQ